MKKSMSAFVFAGAVLALSTLASQADTTTPTDTKTPANTTAPAATTPPANVVTPVNPTTPANTTTPADTTAPATTTTPAGTTTQPEAKTAVETKTSDHAHKARAHKAHVARHHRHVNRKRNAYLHRGYSRRGPPYGYRFGFSTYAGDPFYSDDYYDGGRCYYLHHHDFCRGRKSLDWVRGR